MKLIFFALGLGAVYAGSAFAGSYGLPQPLPGGGVLVPAAPPTAAPRPTKTPRPRKRDCPRITTEGCTPQGAGRQRVREGQQTPRKR